MKDILVEFSLSRTFVCNELRISVQLGVQKLRNCKGYVCKVFPICFVNLKESICQRR